MQTKEAIELLQANSKAGEMVEGTLGKKVFVPNNMKLKSMEIMNKFRDRFRGKLMTNSVNSFAAYVNGNKKAKCFISESDISAEVIFDLGTREEPLHAKHKAVISLNTTAAYNGIMQAVDDRMFQQDFAEFLEDWGFCITATDAEGEKLDIAKAIIAVRNIKIKASSVNTHEVQTFSSNKSSMDSLDAKGTNEYLPAWLIFKCVPRHGLTEREFPLRVSIGIKQKELMFMLRVKNLDQIEEEIHDEFRALIESSLEDADIYSGDFYVG